MLKSENNKFKILTLKSNGLFSIIEDPHKFEQHPNQQNGLNLYVSVLDHSSGIINHVKLYKNKKGLHFKKNGSHYLEDFNQIFEYVPLQIKKVK